MSYEKQRTSQRQTRPHVQHLRTVRRVIKTPDDLDGPRPGAYDIQGRAHGEVPEWIQNPRPRNQATDDDASHVLVSDAEVIPSHEYGDAEAQQIVAATVVIERRIGFERLRHANPSAGGLARRRNPNGPGKNTARFDGTRIPQGNSNTPWSEQHQTGLQEISNPARGRRHSQGCLLEDDEDDHVAQDRFVQGMQSTRFTADKAKEMTYDHPHVVSVLEVFPDANVKRIVDLLRQESLATTFMVLAEESSAEPSDNVAYPTELKHATTYAQATDEDRAIIMSYLLDMFPHIEPGKIESVLMQHSTHNGVAVLSEVGSSSQPSPAKKKAAPMTAKKESLIDDDEDEYEFQHPQTPWMQTQPDLDRKPSAFHSDNKGLKSSGTAAAAAGTPGFAQSQSNSYSGIMERVLKESQQDAIRDQDRFAAGIKKAPPKQYGKEDRKYSPTGRERDSEEFDILKPKGAQKNAFYDLNSLE